MAVLTRSQWVQSTTVNTKKITRKRALRKHHSASHHEDNLRDKITTRRHAAKKPRTSYHQRSSSEIEGDPNRNLAIFGLPKELFDGIISFLPPEAAACFSLTCKEALHLLGTTSWTYFRGRSRRYRAHGSLVKLLQRDLPGSEYCLRCETLHPPLKPPKDHRETRSTKPCMGQDASIDYWPQTASGGYSVVWAHILHAFQSQPPSEPSPPIDLFDGDFTFHHGAVTYRLCSSAHWVNRNLVLTQQHRLRNLDSRSKALRAVDITSLPFRVCPHLSTTTAPPPKTYHSRNGVSNSPFLTNIITRAFPPNLRKGIPRPRVFRALNPSEQRQIADVEMKADFLWRCRSCPTKFRVRYEELTGEIVVTAWHSFGRALYQARQFWSCLVRREGPTLGSAERNSEYYSTARTWADFDIPDGIEIALARW
ncbi:hypothetical protein BDV28DRAFT_161970 [Aspergillus coremiiformis]|uniref:F-box domain-containing protein n=1 Tax=Aspergillus coremiiformis TaxID=138285 RepID=A0A5N6ZH27_9EURO|nr:hypothetical protein BDV28DRAFT_161970 [Aspergillus coremiiformis]